MKTLGRAHFIIEVKAILDAPYIYFQVTNNGELIYECYEGQSQEELEILAKKITDSFIDNFANAAQRNTLYEAVSLAFAAALIQHTGDDKQRQKLATLAAGSAKKMAKQVQGLSIGQGRAPLTHEQRTQNMKAQRGPFLSKIERAKEALGQKQKSSNRTNIAEFLYPNSSNPLQKLRRERCDCGISDEEFNEIIKVNS